MSSLKEIHRNPLKTPNQEEPILKRTNLVATMRINYACITFIFLFSFGFSRLEDAEVLHGSFYRTECNYLWSKETETLV